MRKPLIIIGTIILLICTVLLMGSIYEEYFSVPLTIKHNNQIIHQEKCPITLWRLGMKQKNGGFEKLYTKIVREGHSPVEALNFISQGLGDRMEKLADYYEKEPVNAELIVNKSTPYFTYKSDIDGKTVDINIFAKDVAKALDKGAAELTLRNTQAEVTVDLLKERTQLRGAFSTIYLTSTEERKSNIRLALSSINGHKLEPLEEFSFNTVVGPRKAERGYKSAKIISGGKFVEGIGGGVCQVSTTLYNTVLLSDLEVTYATRHSLPVSYVPPSRDAMVSSTNDFKFFNNTDYPLYLFTNSENNIAQIFIFGQKKDCTIQLKSEFIKSIPYKDYTVSGELLNCPDGYKRLCSGKNGLVSELYLIKNGVSKKVRHDIYSPQHSLWIEEEVDVSSPIELYNTFEDLIDFENLAIDF